MSSYKQIKKEMETEAKEHGEPLDKFITIPNVCKDVDEFINMVWLAGIQVIKASQNGLICDKILLHTSNELNEKLKDIPENDGVWKRIYKEFPPCILYRTMRIDNVEDPNDHHIIIFTDVRSKEGKKQAKQLFNDFAKHGI